MSNKVNSNIGSDNALEDYFLDLIVRKKVIHHEIEGILKVISSSPLHIEYQHRIKILLFGVNNLYLHQWWTLEDGLVDALADEEIRWSKLMHHGIILEVLLRIIEEVFDIPDEDIYSFVLLEERENVEHSLIILIKNVLLLIKAAIEKLLNSAETLSEPPKEPIPAEYQVIEKTLLALPDILLSQQTEHIQELKNESQQIYQKFVLSKKKSIDQIDTLFGD